MRYKITSSKPTKVGSFHSQEKEKKMAETHAQAIRRICIKWRNEKINGYCPITSLIERLQREERKRRLL
jgi:hypothetical protein